MQNRRKANRVALGLAKAIVNIIAGTGTATGDDGDANLIDDMFEQFNIVAFFCAFLIH